MRCCGWLLGLGLLAAGSARAQDMTFAIDETGPDPGPGLSQRPSQTLATALQKYDLEQNAEAAVLLQRVVEGASDDAPERVQQAQFFLAKVLLRLGYLQSASALFDEIALAGPRHGYHDQGLPWLLELGRRMPDPSAVIASVGRYDQAQIEQAARELAPERGAELWLLAGRAALAAGAFEPAAERLGRVPADSPAFLQAQVLAGVAHVRRRRAKPAIAAFQSVLAAIEDDSADVPDSERERMRNLAWLSLGRVYYTAAFTAPDAEQGRLLGNAVEAWSRVEQSSDEWLDALFESAWALFVTDEHARALGNLHALLSPYFPGAFYPEAHVLRAVIYFNSCQMDNADAALARLHRLYDPVSEALLRATDGGFDAAAARALLAAVEDPGSQLQPATRAVLGRVLGDRELRRARAALDALGTEERALAKAPAALRTSSLGERIQQDVLVARSLQLEQVGTLVQARVERLLRELQEVSNQADTIEIETLAWRRGQIGIPPVTPSARGRSVVVDSEHVVWPFNGEYWRDELGYYRQELPDACEPR